MKHTLHLLVRAACAVILLSTSTQVRADFPQQRKALDELQAAKTADDPMPLLKSAKDRIANANKGNKGGRQGRRDRQNQRGHQGVQSWQQGQDGAED